MANALIPRPTARKQECRGQYILETAFILLPLLALIFLIADVSLVVFLRGTLQHAVREGARFAITFSPTYGATTCTSQATCIKKVVQDSAVGFLSGSNISYIDIKYYAPCSLSTPYAGPTVCAAIPGPPAIPARPINYANQTGNVIEVSVLNYPWNWMVPLPLPGLSSPGAGLTITTTSSDVLQGYPIGTFTPPAP